MSSIRITALSFVLCSGLADACDTFTISGRVVGQGADLDTWIGIFQGRPTDRAEPVGSAWADAGEFELDVPCGEGVVLLAAQKGAVPLAKSIPRSKPTTVELRFAPGLSLTGSVRTDQNLPISGARITVTRIDEAEVRLPESLATWRSSSDGTFVAGGLVLGTYRVIASADGHMPSELDVVVEEGRASRVDVRLPRAFFIAGRVVDTSGTAAVGAEIHGEPSIMDGGVTAETTATTDSDGVFRLGPLRKGQRILVSARADLWRSDAAYVAAPIEDLVLTLHQAVEIRGSVSNALTGQLLDDFALKAYGPEVRSFAFRDAEGEFSAAVFWQTHYIVISAPGFVSWHMPIDFGSGGGEYDFGEVALALERVATGRVFDAASGLPVQGASVQRWFDESDFRNRLALDPASRVAPVATTDEDGRFRLSGLPGGDVLLKANPQGFSPEAVVELPAGTDHIDIEVNLASTRIEGMLLTEEGIPAEGIVYVWEKDGTGKGVTGEGLWGTSVRAWGRVDQGRFRVVLPERGEQYLVGARSEMGLVENQIVTVQDYEAKEIHLVVQRLGRVSGLLAGLDTGETARLRILDESGRAVKPGIAAPSIANGPYSLQGVPKGRFTLRAKGNGRAIAREFESDGDGETHVDLFFTGDSRLSGVVRAGGRPIPGIKIETTPRSKSLTSGETRATSTGAYAIDGLDDGEYVVRVRGRSFGVELSGDTFYDIELGPLAVSGVVTAEGPVLGALVTVTPTSAEAGLWGSDQADSRGSFRIDGLEEGEYTVRVSLPGYQETARTVFVGSVIENLDVHLSPADGR